MISLSDIEAAAARLRGVAHRTPVFTSSTLDRELGGSVWLKAENLQRGGSFKIRGAYNKVSTLAEGERAAGVVAFSSGNHAQAVAIAAGLCETRAVIVMPDDAPPTKLAATAGYGAEIVTYDRYREDRAEIADRLARDRGLTLIPPYDDPSIMAGQGTAALELIGQVGPPDVLVVPVGGGGLIAGSGTALRAHRDDAVVIGVEPEGADDTRRSLETGTRVELDGVPRTIADGLQPVTPGISTLEVNRRVVDRVVVVTDEQIRAAMRFLFERTKLVVEPSGAVGVAALLAGIIDAGGRRVGVILSGGNVGADRFIEVISEGSGRDA
ncbi:MAG: pyridoxal-phosphate dependent enzyme [Actinomycetota bacterium]